MLICPNCRSGPFSSSDSKVNRCTSCGHKSGVRNNILQMMCPRADHTYSVYQRFYEQLAAEDLRTPITEQVYAEALNENTAVALGDVRGKHGCDLGVGRGHLLRQMLGRGAKMTAVDIAMPYLEALVGYGDLQRVQADAEHLPFREEFDFVTCTDVLEHVLNPGNLLYCLNECLVPGGLAAIRVPADENLLIYSTHLGCAHEMVHLRTFSKAVLHDMIEGAGFKVRAIEEDGHSLSMLLPTEVTNDPQRRYELDQVRALLSGRGITPGELLKTPVWFRERLSRTYFYLIFAEKTHRIVSSPSQGFELVPIAS